jgi:tripartite-type tricarboxylate transporter receptor subunit TctC
VLGAVGTPLLLARAIERGEPALLGRLRFVAAVLEEPVLLVAAAGGPFATLAALRQPGEAARVATPASGSAAHLAAGLLAPALPLAPLAFANAAAARQAVLAGHLPCAMLGAPDAMAALRDGRLVALGLARAAPTAVLPGIPPLAERGVPASIAAWRGFAVSAAAPEAGLAGLRRALRAAVADPDYVAEAESAGQIAAFLDGPAWSAQLELLHRDLQARWTSTPWLIRR